MSATLLTRATRRLSREVQSADIRAALRQAGVGHAPTIFTHTTVREREALFQLATACPAGSVAVEIGSYLGASSCYLAAGLGSGATLWCIDTWGNHAMDEGERDTFAEFTRHTAGVAERVRTLRARSESLTPAELPAALALAFIDGDHSYAATRQDVALVLGAIVEGGVLAFHDSLASQGVSRVIGETLATGDWTIGGHVDNLVWLRRMARWDYSA